MSYLNQQHPSIRFTMETENNNEIAFLDTLVTREPDAYGKLLTRVYRKPTHTDQYHVSYRVKHSKRNSISTRAHVLFSIY